MTSRTSRARAARRLGACAVIPIMAITVLPSSAAADRPSPRDGSSVLAAVPVSAAAANARIARLVPKRMTAKPLGKQVSVKVADLFAGRQIFKKRANKPRLPASNMKLVTAVTAMETIGLSTRLPTTVVTEGAAGRKIIVKAGGDPVLTSKQLRDLAHRTATALVAGLPAAPAPVPATPPATDPPTPPVTTPPAPARLPVKLKVYLDDSLFAAPTAAPGWPRSYQPQVVRPVRPFVRDGRGGWDTAADAGSYFAAAVRSRVASAVASRPDLAVSVKYKGRSRATSGAPEIARFAGNSLAGAVSWMLLVSDNNIAEMLYRLSAVATGRPGTWAGGRDTALATLAALGVRTTGLVLADGSGVSRADRLTTTALVQLLRRAASPDRPELNRLRSMLPVSGVSGTLKAAYGRYTTAPSRCARGKVSAKTGTLHDTIALSGYTTGADGRDKIFSVLVNNRPEHRYSPLSTRRAVDTLAATVTGCA